MRYQERILKVLGVLLIAAITLRPFLAGSSQALVLGLLMCLAATLLLYGSLLASSWVVYRYYSAGTPKVLAFNSPRENSADQHHRRAA
ncbi:hypothetical protein [Aeoliella mucimassa]|uniref:Uncharacterized protein n=1 Tax=Aeoliella mucimassa TaxID=2527972 RepID=A0A518ARS8_9BACT|nr:hypothetical protein [Aeoliella mucimassa]QDU57431.1 hypothetical protein Pan181_36470 [Aeoliella mucimassa]